MSLSLRGPLVAPALAAAFGLLSSCGEQQASSVAEVRPLVVHLRADGSLTLDGRPTTVATLEEDLKQRTDGRPERFELRVTADPAVPVEKLDPVFAVVGAKPGPEVRAIL